MLKMKKHIENIITLFDSEFNHWMKWNKPWIKPPLIANGHKFPETCGEDCEPLRVICYNYFSFNEYSFIYQFFESP